MVYALIKPFSAISGLAGAAGKLNFRSEPAGFKERRLRFRMR
jgi:hypothetical protein